MKPALLPFVSIRDDRGVLSIATGSALPFSIKRVFFIHDVLRPVFRGDHAHREQHQLLVCACGSVALEAEHKDGKLSAILYKPDVALHAPPLTWLKLSLTPGSTLVVFASGVYDDKEYIRSYNEFKAFL